MKHFLKLIFFLLLTSILHGQSPMEKYAISLQKRIIELDKKCEVYQMQLRYYHTLPNKIVQAKGRVEELKKEHTKNVEEKRILTDSLNAIIKRIEAMEDELSKQKLLFKITTDSLNATLKQLSKAKTTIDSLIKTNAGLRVTLDNALIELSDIQEVVFGILKPNGTFTYRAQDQGSKKIFLCPKEFGTNNCDLTHVGFKISIYSKEDLSNYQYVLILYQKDSYGDFIYHTHLQFGFNKQTSIYEGYYKFTSNLLGQVKLDNAVPSGRDYVVGLMEFRNKSLDIDQINLSFGKAKEKNLLIRTKP